MKKASFGTLFSENRKQKTEARNAPNAVRCGERCPAKGNAAAPPFRRPGFPLPSASAPTAVSLSFGRKKEKSPQKRERKPRASDTAKAATASAPAVRKSAILFRLPRQSASTHNADGSALHLPQPCLVSNPADISQKIHAPAKCCARPCGFGNVMAVPIVLLANAYKHSAPADP